MAHPQIQLEATGKAMHELATELYPICRSITGDGVRETLARLGRLIPLEVREVPTGEQAFDWTIPQEWNIRDAYIKDAAGRRVVDFRESNLLVVHGSRPIRETIRWEELKPHLHTLPDHPGWIPYRTCHHTNDWGFCLSHDQFEQLEHLAKAADREYEVCIDATLCDGSLTYGELLVPGETSDEVLISTHICHPSLANDNLSGISVATHLARYVREQPRRYTYRFLFLPATIGAIAWLSANESDVDRVKHGWVLSVVGDAGPSTYKKSRRGDAEVDRAFEHILRSSGQPYSLVEFDPLGYDQRQFCSPGFNLPMGCLMRTPNGRYPEYHTSADNLDLIQPEFLADSWAKCTAVVRVLEGNRRYANLNPKCEPRLGPRGLYHAFGARPDREHLQAATMWVLNFSDGGHTLLDIAERSDIDFDTIREAADLLIEHELLEKVIDHRTTAAGAACNPERADGRAILDNPLQT
ncbi:MAG: DUF4910 domain-containing protein [Planctomycetes bacterium]|nr:DUF4910 domain-containing protein [Planctomycetota bacterium]